MTTSNSEGEPRTVLDELRDAAYDYWSERYFGPTEESSARAETDWYRALSRISDATDAAKKAEADGPAIPGNTHEGRVAIAQRAKRTAGTRRLTFDKPRR